MPRVTWDDQILDAFWQIELRGGYDLALAETARRFGVAPEYVEKLLKEQDELDNGNV